MVMVRDQVENATLTPHTRLARCGEPLNSNHQESAAILLSDHHPPYLHFDNLVSY